MSDDLREKIARFLLAKDYFSDPDYESVWKSATQIERNIALGEADQILSLPEIAGLLKAKKEGKVAVLADDQEYMNMPDPDPHGYEGESEAISATKEAAYKAGWRRVK